eukprot:5357582-Prymnesium_polylepis.1
MEESGLITKNTIVHADWNSVEDVGRDVRYESAASETYPNTHGPAIAAMLTQKGLTDVHRLVNGDKDGFTRLGDTVFTRIDRMYSAKYNSKWRWRSVEVQTSRFRALGSDHLPVCATIDKVGATQATKMDTRIDPRFLERAEVRARVGAIHSRIYKRPSQLNAVEKWERFKEASACYLLEYTGEQRRKKTK